MSATTYPVTRTAVRASIGVLVAAAMSIGLAAPASAAPSVDSAPVLTAATTLAAPSAGGETCKSPWVWREARPADRVCVTVETRRDTAAENKLALSRQLTQENHTCRSPYVWREAYPGDKRCVPVESRDRAFKDNAQAASRRIATSKPAPAKCLTTDGIASTGSTVKGSPDRFRYPDSPAAGARWNKCTRLVTVYWSGFTATHFNVRVNGDAKQHEVRGSERQQGFEDWHLPEGTNTFEVQACTRGSWGPFSSKSQCSAWSPKVRVGVHVGVISQG